ncbi:MAG: T9SS type A sorting domain-containing protein [Gilvibacter sp.]
MKTPTLFIIAGLLFCTISSCNDHNSEFNLEQIPTEHPGDLLFMQRAFPLGKIDTEAYSKAIEWKQLQPKPKAGADPIWEFAGPLNIGGRISDIAIHPTEADTYYIGAASGGIFKTTDGGGSWVPIFDDQQYLSIGDIEISDADPDKMYVGTGEPNAGGGSLAYDGNGIFKSEDGGITWASKGLPDIGSVGKIVIDPNDDETLYVGAMGPLFRKDSNRGVYKSSNGGNTWDQILTVTDSTGVIDMAIHPTNSNIVYAATWERVRTTAYRVYGGATSRIYRSQDAGTTWNELTVGLPSLPADKGRISIDISQSNPDVLYALYANRNGSIQGVYKTTNGGDSWSTQSIVGLNNVGFHWWFGGIFIDPTNENTIYNVGFEIEKSTDGGLNWGTAFPGVHVDQHAMAFNPSVAGEVLLGNDGGLYLSFDDGASSIKNETLPITQYYRINSDPQNSDRRYGGSQDNSTFRTTTAGLSDFVIINGGDGFMPLIDPTNSSVIYALSQRGFLRKSIDDAASFTTALTGIDPAELKNWDTPIVFDPADSDILFYGAERVYKTTDGAANWTAISTNLHDGPYAGNNGFGTIVSLDVSPLDSDKITAGTDDGNVWVTSNGGASWTNVSASLPDRWITKVLHSRFDTNTLYVTISGYRFGEDFGHVYKSTDLGANWTNIGTSLPDIPVNDIVQDSFGNLFLGTDIGVLASNNEGATWAALGINMPAVVVTDLSIHEADGILFAGTYGRSSYKLDISTNVLTVDEVTANFSVVLYPNPANDFISIELPISGQLKGGIYNSLGQLVMSLELKDGERFQHVDISELSTGVYFVSLEIDQTKITKRIIKK